MNTVNNSTNQTIRLLDVSEAESGQRLDNFLMKHLKGVPRSMIYRLLRKGSVRVNKKRKKPDYRIEPGDIVKIPPVRTSQPGKVEMSANQISRIKQSVLFEDDSLLIINKAAGMAVHGGSGLAWGLIEVARQAWPEYTAIELAHRLDRFTSGCLILAKTRSALLHIQAQIKSCSLKKKYLTVTQGQWPSNEIKIDSPLLKNVMQGGERMVQVNPDGKQAISFFRTKRQYPVAALCEVEIVTGRTHQIRVHAASEGHAVAGDSKYGDAAFNKKLKLLGLKRMFLHAHQLSLQHPDTNQSLSIEAPLAPELESVLQQLEKSE